MNSTNYAKRTQYKPIDFFFRGVVDCKARQKKVAFVDAFQILNDRYLGRMSAQNYFYIAESSVRINELNIIALEELKNYDLVFKENFLIPDVVYFLPISTRFLEDDKDFLILLDTIKDSGYKKANLVFTFFAPSIATIDEEAKKRYNKLRRAGFKTAISQFGEYYNSIDLFSKFVFDYLRCEAQYFDADQNKKKVLAMVVKYCKENNIELIMEGVDTPAQYARFKREDIKYVTGRGCSKLSRFITNEFLLLPELTGDKKNKYLEKLAKELKEQEKKELKELDELRRATIERIKAQGVDKVMPLAPRPELAKSPYQVRLEQQKNMAKKAQEERIEELTSGSRSSRAKEKMLMDQMKPMRYEGDVQAALALSFASDIKNSLKTDTNTKPQEEKKEVEEVKVSITKEESNIDAPVRPDIEKDFKKKEKFDDVKADHEKEDKLLNEYAHDNMFDALGADTGFGGFGVQLHIKNKEEGEPDIVGSMTEDGKWQDEDGNTFNGYFDENDNWVEYEEFNGAREGHYNEDYQWVDSDGGVYDGYFDEEGRWIDYSYSDENGEIVDNGYFDNKLKKWIPFGYFDEDGTYHKF